MRTLFTFSNLNEHLEHESHTKYTTEGFVSAVYVN